MLKDDELSGYVADPATGFLEKNKNNSFGAFEKTKFLKDLKRTGNQSRILDSLGCTNAEFDFALRKDLKFKAAYANALLEMRHEIEGNLYTAALRGKTKESQVWLQAFFPETYKPSAAKRTKQATVDPLEALYKKL